MPLKKNLTLSKTQKKERASSSNLGIRWRQIYKRSYYFDNKIKPYDTLVKDIQDSYLLITEFYNQSRTKPFDKGKNYKRRYNSLVVCIIKIMHILYKNANIRVTNKNLILAWGLAFDNKSPFYQERIKSIPALNIYTPTQLPTPYNYYFDESSKDNWEDREKKITDYSFKKLERRISKFDIQNILMTIAAASETNIQGKETFLLPITFPLMKKNGEDKHLFSLLDKFLTLQLNKQQEKLSKEKYKKCKSLLQQRKYFTLLNEVYFKIKI